MFDLVIHGNRVVTSAGVGKYDVAIARGKIERIAPLRSIDDAQAHEVIDASDKIVVPGGVDAHIHCKWPTSSGGLSAGSDVVSNAALFGGTTTLIDFAVWDPGMTLEQAVERRERDFHRISRCDYAFHVTLHGDVPETVVDQIPETIAAGFPSYKMYTTDVRPARANWKMHFGDIWEVLQRLSKHGGIACIHSEDNDLVMHMYRKNFATGRGHFTHMAEVHSALSEDLSFRRIIRLAENVPGAALYLMHVSAATGVAAIEESRARGFPIYGETLHPYTLFTSDDYKRPNGQIYHTYPSLKSASDNAALWQGIMKTGAISTVCTDGVCTAFDVKVARDQIDNTTGGNVGVEPRVSIIYTEMVEKRGSSLEKFVDTISTNAAKIMGLYPRKGAIAQGSDADIAILDTKARREITASGLHESDYTPWEGYRTAVWPCLTILRGKRVVEMEQFVGGDNFGERIPRKISAEILAGPSW